MVENYDKNCEYCGCVCNTEEMHRIKSDEYDYLDICDSCYEGCIE